MTILLIVLAALSSALTVAFLVIVGVALVRHWSSERAERMGIVVSWGCACAFFFGSISVACAAFVLALWESPNRFLYSVVLNVLVQPTFALIMILAGRDLCLAWSGKLPIRNPPPEMRGSMQRGFVLVSLVSMLFFGGLAWLCLRLLV